MYFNMFLLHFHHRFHPDGDEVEHRRPVNQMYKTTDYLDR
jgi:hypothetical protein